jgi:DNA-binding beta-propeller fold protein YncE
MQRRVIAPVVALLALAAGLVTAGGVSLDAQRGTGTGGGRGTGTGAGRAGDPVIQPAGRQATPGGRMGAPGAQRGPAVPLPRLQVDPLWPKPLPNGWILGSVTGVDVDSRNHIWIVHRGADSLTPRTENGLGTDPPTAELCCRPAPPVLEFDQDGNLVSSWGGPGQGYDWPATPGGISVDSKGNVWIAAAGWPEPPGARGSGRGGRGGGGGGAAAPARPHDAHLLKFSPKGQFLLQIGKPGASEGNSSTMSFNRPASVQVDTRNNEIYVADGYGNRRVVVLDANTGAYKRHWGAYGSPPDDEAPPAYDPALPASGPFRTVTCAVPSRDGHVYVCDRGSNRIQVFTREGKFISEAQVAPATLGNGSVWDVALSSDANQAFLFVADGQNHTVLILRRDTLEPVGRIGAGGRWPGTFFAVGSVALDSRGNLYTGETFQGKRVQKFVPAPPPAGRGRRGGTE